jgi:hypothetical protein
VYQSIHIGSKSVVNAGCVISCSRDTIAERDTTRSATASRLNISSRPSFSCNSPIGPFILTHQFPNAVNNPCSRDAIAERDNVALPPVSRLNNSLFKRTVSWLQPP